MSCTHSSANSSYSDSESLDKNELEDLKDVDEEEDEDDHHVDAEDEDVSERTSEGSTSSSRSALESNSWELEEEESEGEQKKIDGGEFSNENPLVERRVEENTFDAKRGKSSQPSEGKNVRGQDEEEEEIDIGREVEDTQETREQETSKEDQGDKDYEKEEVDPHTGVIHVTVGRPSNDEESDVLTSEEEVREKMFGQTNKNPSSSGGSSEGRPRSQLPTPRFVFLQARLFLNCDSGISLSKRKFWIPFPLSRKQTKTGDSLRGSWIPKLLLPTKPKVLPPPQMM